MSIPSLLVTSDEISSAPVLRQELAAPAADAAGAASGTEIEQDGVSQWLWARFDAVSDAVVAGVVAVWLQLGAGWIVHAASLVSVAGAAAMIRLVNARRLLATPRIPSLLVISNGI